MPFEVGLHGGLCTVDGGDVEFQSEVTHVIIRQGYRLSVEGIGFDDVCTGLEIFQMDGFDDVRTCDAEQVVIALEV